MRTDTIGYGDGLTAPYGEPTERVRCLANGDEGEFLDRYTWCPGNHTRYDLMYGRRMSEPADGDDGVEYLIVFLNPYGQRAAAMTFREPTYLHYSYIVEKLGVNEADAVGIMQFLDRMGHSVGYPKPMGLPELHAEASCRE